MDIELDRERERRERHRRMMQERRERNRRLRRIYAMIRFWAPYAAGCVALIAVIAVGVNFFAGRDAAPGENAEEEVVQQDNGQAGNMMADAGQMSAGQTAPGQAEITAGLGGNEPAEGAANGPDAQNAGADGTSPGAQALADAQPDKIYEAHITDSTRQLGEELDSDYAILIDMETDEILAQKGWDTIINPASMTKILTVLVAAEHVENLDDTFTITLNETDYSYVNECSNVGFAENEVVTIRDLFYGTILPSGGDAAAALAAYVAGSREAFVDMMNAKLEELGLSDTAHMTNCVGLYDEEHYCTVYDMAMILEAAMDNELCREVLTAHTYTTSATPQHPEGILISNWFLRRIEDKDTGGQVLYAKTGYVAQAGSCAASYQIADNGKGYLCVTAQAGSSWKCIYDHVALYKEYSGT